MAKVGGKRPGAGRPKASKSKATAEARATISERAKEYTDEALQALADILKSQNAPAAAKVSAATALLDRGYGKPVQSTELSNPDGSLNNQPTIQIVNADRTN
jgi:phage gp46-like protein